MELPAFDTVDHTILLQRLETSFGITDSALWFPRVLVNTNTLAIERELEKEH